MNPEAFLSGGAENNNGFVLKAALLKAPFPVNGSNVRTKRMEKKAKKFIEIDTVEKARKVAGWLEDKQASDVTGIDVRRVCPIAEIVMVVTAKGVRHSQALADHVLDMLGEEKLEYLGMEGYKSGDWILLDLNDIIVHIFQEDNRSFYNIEGLWSEGTQIELDN